MPGSTEATKTNYVYKRLPYKAKSCKLTCSAISATTHLKPDCYRWAERRGNICIFFFSSFLPTINSPDFGDWAFKKINCSFTTSFLELLARVCCVLSNLTVFVYCQIETMQELNDCRLSAIDVHQTMSGETFLRSILYCSKKHIFLCLAYLQYLFDFGL